ncbi:MAG: DUF378 domain-containing protein [Candidatus Epulonipiscioides saccharophilum]|nr:DUF378 domain-containing protein [Epulopiscium sp. SCG-C07WGA-EpuloA2]ONI48283.1 DUF378 domain-containing protein [Epulopiscium sp. SCG-B10WGA-EpuloB]OON94688.1 MAG: DUF378 domain-containing protein [Epulopiscium sp. AS2M-Bin001]
MNTRTFDYIALAFVVIGAINWGLIGFFQFDLISLIFGGWASWVSRVIYAIIGICGIYALTLFGRVSNDSYSDQ